MELQLRVCFIVSFCLAYEKHPSLYYGPGHGKCQYDPEGGVLKTAARRHIRDKSTEDKVAIASCAELVNFGTDFLSTPQRPPHPTEVDDGRIVKRHFVLLSQPIEEPADTAAVSGSRRKFQWRAGPDGVVYNRTISCY